MGGQIDATVNKSFLQYDKNIYKIIFDFAEILSRSFFYCLLLTGIRFRVTTGSLSIKATDPSFDN